MEKNPIHPIKLGENGRYLVGCLLASPMLRC